MHCAPGEDPYLTGSYGIEYVKALQEQDSNGHPRVNSYLKHFDAYSTETNRMHSDFNISQFDWWDTFLPQYKRVFTEANAGTSVCVRAGVRARVFSRIRLYLKGFFLFFLITNLDF